MKMTVILNFVTRTLEQMEHECGPEYPFVKHLRSRVSVLQKAGYCCETPCYAFEQDNDLVYADRVAMLDARVTWTRVKYRARHNRVISELRDLHH
jgi:hypothetical protein